MKASRGSREELAVLVGCSGVTFFTFNVSCSLISCCDVNSGYSKLTAEAFCGAECS